MSEIDLTKAMSVAHEVAKLSLEAAAEIAEQHTHTEGTHAGAHIAVKIRLLKQRGVWNA